MHIFNSKKSSIYAPTGMVATSQPLASQVGCDILKKGGNAVDAAISIAAMVTVLEPMMTGLGGDVFALVYSSKDNKLHGLNASGIQPAALNQDYFSKKNLKAIPSAGFDSVNIPGAFDGWVQLHKKFGSLPFSELLEGAIHYAKEGYVIGQKTAQFWEYGTSKLKLFPDSAKAYLINGKAPKAGERFKQPQLAQTLKLLSSGHSEAFYEGSIAEKIVAYFKSHGHQELDLSDFKKQKSEWVMPLSSHYRGHELFLIPPNSEGLIALEALKILEGFDLKHANPIDYEHYIIEALKLSFADGHRYIADPHFYNSPVETILSNDYISKRRALITSKANPTPSAGKINGDTTYFTVVDKDRNVVSFIMSISDVFGSGIVIPELGMVMNNRGCEFSLDPNHPNCVKPYKRPYHTIIPSMLFKDKEPIMTFGCMGGNMQPQGQVQIISNLIDRDMGLQEAIDAPRTRVLGGNLVSIEETFDPAIFEGLIKKGHQPITDQNIPSDWSSSHVFASSFKGGAQAIFIDKKNHTLIGASDPRLDGTALGY